MRTFGSVSIRPSIQTTLILANSQYSSGWGSGKACTQTDAPRTYGGFKDYEYYNGTTLSVPGVTSGKLLASPQLGTGEQYRYVTQDNWRVECITVNVGGFDVEGFKATSPEGVMYTFDRYRLVQTIPLVRGKITKKFHAFMQVS